MKSWKEFPGYREIRVGRFTLGVGFADVGRWEWSIFVNDIEGNDVQLQVGNAESESKAKRAAVATLLLILAPAQLDLGELYP